MNDNEASSTELFDCIGLLELPAGAIVTSGAEVHISGITGFANNSARTRGGETEYARYTSCVLRVA